MNTPMLRPSMADAIESELAALGTEHSRLEQNQRHARRVTAAFSVAAAAVALTGGAIVAIGMPGETTTTPVGSVVKGTYTGTTSLDLGPVPDGVGAVIIDVTCIQGGLIEVPLNGSNADAVSWQCNVRKDTVHITDGKLPDPGSTSITITADPGTQWTVTAQYAATSTTGWGVNDDGQTYGIPNRNGTPDLTPALATNGREGYISNHELVFFVGDGTINVYESDGITVIGQFPIGSN